MRKIVFLCTLLSIFSLQAEEVKFPVIKGFTIDKKIDRFDAGTLFNHINGAAAVFLDYGFVEMYHAVYHTTNKGYIVVEAYRHGNPDQAFGMYVTERTGSNNYIDIGAQGYVEEGVLNASGGDWYIKLYSHRKDAATAAAMKQIASGLEVALFPNAKIPAEIAWFPTEGRVKESDLYIAKEVLGHPFLTEAYTSSYNEGEYELFLFKKQSPEELKKMISAYCAWAKAECNNKPEEIITINDRYNGTVYLLSKGAYAAMVVGIENADQASSLLEALLWRGGGNLKGTSNNPKLCVTLRR